MSSVIKAIRICFARYMVRSEWSDAMDLLAEAMRDYSDYAVDAWMTEDVARWNMIRIKRDMEKRGWYLEHTGPFDQWSFQVVRDDVDRLVSCE